MSIFSTIREHSGLSLEDVSQVTGYHLRTVYRWENGDVEPKKAILDLVRRYSEAGRPPIKSRKKPAFTFIDLFAGIGGMRLGFEAAGGDCVFTSEWDEWSRKTYSANFDIRNHPFVGDITKVDEASIPAHDVLVAGFPCQPFSIAGVSKKNALGRAHGFLDEAQGTLFFDIARIIAHHRPAAFLLENVKNLVSHDRGNTFRVITNALEKELGYRISFRVIDAQSFVPQHRERIFVVGFREDAGFSFDKIVIPDKELAPRLQSILHPEDGTEPEERPFTEGDLGAVSDKYTLSNHLWTYLKNYAEKHRIKGNGFGFGLFGPDDVARTLSARYYKDGSEVLIKRGVRKSPRRLTPRECARLMGFDRPGRVPFRIRVSDTQAYKQFGNAVVPPVVEVIARAMSRGIKKLKTPDEPEDNPPQLFESSIGKAKLERLTA